MLHYLYLDQGGQNRQALKYSLLGLKAQTDAKVAIYTDTPDIYAAWPVEVIDMAARARDWSGGGLYLPRLKPTVVLDALARFGAPVCLVDSRSVIGPGFHAEVTDRMAPEEIWSVTRTALLMGWFVKMNPYPPLKGFRTTLPHRGAYRYDQAQSWLYDGALIGASPVHGPVLEDSLAFIDALIGRAKKFPAIASFALSEVLRLSQIPVAEIGGGFQSYEGGYMARQTAKALPADWNDLTPPKEPVKMNTWRARWGRVIHTLPRFS